MFLQRVLKILYGVCWVCIYRYTLYYIHSETEWKKSLLILSIKSVKNINEPNSRKAQGLTFFMCLSPLCWQKYRLRHLSLYIIFFIFLLQRYLNVTRSNHLAYHALGAWVEVYYTQDDFMPHGSFLQSWMRKAIRILNFDTRHTNER